MRNPLLPLATIVVGGSSSHCNNCGEGVCYWESVKTHDECCGYGDQPDGCGVEFTHITFTYMDDAAVERIKAARPDLEYVDLYPRNV